MGLSSEWDITLGKPRKPATKAQQDRVAMRVPGVKPVAGAGGDVWELPGLKKLGDKYDRYTVRRMPVEGRWGEEWSCSCQMHMKGMYRKFCSHIRAVVEWRKANPGVVVPVKEPEPEPVPVKPVPVVKQPTLITPLPDLIPDLSSWEEELEPAPVSIVPAAQRLSGIRLPSWAGKGLRPSQADLVVETVEAFESGYRYVIADLPTGFGKTLYADAVRQVLGIEKAIYVCTTKALQDQVMRDFPGHALLKGRGNYKPRLDPWGSCDDCVKKTLPKAMCGLCEEEEGVSRDPDTGLSLCPYTRAKELAIRARVVVMNTAYFLAVMQTKGGGGFAGRDLVVVDEADTLESQLMGAVDVLFTRDMLRRFESGRPDLKSKPESWKVWLEGVALPGLVERVRQIVKRGAHLNPDGAKELRRVQGYVDRVKVVLEDVDTNWVMDVKDGWGDDPAGTGSVHFRPIRVKRFGEARVIKHGERFLFMSGTIIDPHVFAEEIGLPEGSWKFVQDLKGFDKRRRPVFAWPVAPMSHKVKADSRPLMARRVMEIARMWPKERVLVHTVSHELTRYLVEWAGKEGEKNRDERDVAERLVWFETAKDRERALKEYAGREGAVMIAAGLERGVDFPDELCRVQVIAKIPYPNLKDKQVSARLYSPGGQAWYRMHTIRSIVQMTGRGMRHAGDWCRTYVLDDNFRVLWQQSKRLFPPWWRDAVRWDTWDPLVDVLEAEGGVE